MVGSSSCSSSSSSSSCASFSSLDGVSVITTVKFLCSYGGRILPRRRDGKLRYVGGDTRVLAVHRSIPFSELEAKLRELCGWAAVSLRCQLPSEDLDDALVSVTSDEDLANVFHEYDLAAHGRRKIPAFLLPAAPQPPIRPVPTPAVASRRIAVQGGCPCGIERIAVDPRLHRGGGRLHRACFADAASRGRHCLVVSHGNHWQ